MTIEKVEIKSTKSRSNIYRVPMRQWRKWGALGRQVFNEVYSAMAGNQRLFLHQKQEKASRSHWRTTAWNAAWTAADATR